MGAWKRNRPCPAPQGQTRGDRQIDRSRFGVILRPEFAQEILKPPQRLGTDMMFNAFCIDRRRILIDAQGDQKTVHNFMTLPTAFRQGGTGGCQGERLIRLRRDQSFIGQPLDNSMHGYVTDREPFRQILQSTDPLPTEYLGDRFHIIFGGFCRMIFPRSPMRFRIREFLCHTPACSAVALDENISPV